MGGSSSTTRSSGGSYSRSSRGSYDQRSQYGSSYYMQDEYYTPQHQYEPSPPSSRYGSKPPQPHLQKRLERKYSRISDNYASLDEVTAALAQAGLESSNLIVGIDFTKSNEWTGARSFKHRSLHNLGNGPNPYEQAISIIGKTLSTFDDDNSIPCYGFGDATTHYQDVFSFYPEDRFCNGFEEVLNRYREMVPHLCLAGPTSFAPIIEMAMTIVEQSGGQYHVLLIIADGQVTRSVDTEIGQLSSHEQKTIDAIIRASEYPLSIVLVGVGDGPWDMMSEFDDNIPSRLFDNFQFVNFTKIMSKNMDLSRKQTEFALSALMEIPSQYKATLEHGLLGRRTGNAPDRIPLPPPVYGSSTFNSRPKPPNPLGSFQQSEARNPFVGYNDPINTYSRSSLSYHAQLCPICLSIQKDMAFGCGHQVSVTKSLSAPFYVLLRRIHQSPVLPLFTMQTCCSCVEDLQLCPICRSYIQTRIRLY
ncbi:hypothetical protein SAY87_016878 [Trapa incisa]|uniref:VWFA domain-containing protein n=1 Tax=Trapa incisa TaxID=236973 RepID=A0AAN7LIG6_9MYRT|nr:hypothetical protein SAY87_016878 [Trapa incisa]